jgi:hypothetical protein
MSTSQQHTLNSDKIYQGTVGQASSRWMVQLVTGWLQHSNTNSFKHNIAFEITEPAEQLAGAAASTATD